MKRSPGCGCCDCDVPEVTMNVVYDGGCKAKWTANTFGLTITSGWVKRNGIIIVDLTGLSGTLSGTETSVSSTDVFEIGVNTCAFVSAVDELDPAPEQCICMGDEGERDFPLLKLTVTGSGIPRPLKDLFGERCPAPASCPDVAGTYILGCGDTLQVSEDELVCTSLGYTYYYRISITYTWTSGGAPAFDYPGTPSYNTGILHTLHLNSRLISVGSGSGLISNVAGTSAFLEWYFQYDDDCSSCPIGFDYNRDTTSPAATQNQCDISGLDMAVELVY